MRQTPNLKHEESEEIEIGSLDPNNLEYVESTIRELGKHLSELSREEQMI